MFATDRRKIVIRALDTTETRRFVRPLSMRPKAPAADHSYSWGREGDGTAWMDAAVGDPPVVRFGGAALEVRGPWALRIPLD